MAGLGEQNPLPFKVGGGPSVSEQACDALKQAVGEGGSAAEGTIEADWRRARGRGLRACMAVERSIMQAFPDVVSDFIPVYEEILGITANVGLSDEQRRAQIVDRWVRAIDATAPKLEEQLQAIDPLLEIIFPDRDTLRTTIPGRAFEDYLPGNPAACGPAFGGGHKVTSYPNYSQDFVCIVRYHVPSGQLTAENKRTIERVNALLNEALPAWVDFWVITSIGFILDESLLDVGAFYP